MLCYDLTIVAYYTAQPLQLIIASVIMLECNWLTNIVGEPFFFCQNSLRTPATATQVQGSEFLRRQFDSGSWRSCSWVILRTANLKEDLRKYKKTSGTTQYSKNQCCSSSKFYFGSPVVAQQQSIVLIPSTIKRSRVQISVMRINVTNLSRNAPVLLCSLSQNKAGQV